MFPGHSFATPWTVLDYVSLAAGDDLATADGVAGETGFVLLAGTISFTASIGERQVVAPAVVLAGSDVPVLRATAEARMLAVQVTGRAVPGSAETRVEVIAEHKLKWRPAIHRGRGEIATRHVWEAADFASSWTFLDHAVLSAGSSVGYHYHDALEECFVILSGKGLMTVADRTFTVGPGSVTFQGIGQGHGIYNPAGEPLDFLRIAVAMPDENATTIDLHDDLTARTPGA